MDSSKLFQNLVVLRKKELLNVSVLQLYKLESSLLHDQVDRQLNTGVHYHL